MSQSDLFQWRRITGRQSGPHLLILGGVHGDEFEPMVAIRRLAAKVSAAELRGTLTLVPVVNEPAFLCGQRVAADGLDLARTFPGRADGSITERIAHAAGELIRAADYLVDLHTAGTTMDIVPLTGYMLHRNEAILDKRRKMAAAFNLPLVWGTTPDLEGRSLSLAARSQRTGHLRRIPRRGGVQFRRGRCLCPGMPECHVRPNHDRWPRVAQNGTSRGGGCTPGLRASPDQQLVAVYRILRKCDAIGSARSRRGTPRHYFRPARTGCETDSQQAEWHDRVAADLFACLTRRLPGSGC